MCGHPLSFYIYVDKWIKIKHVYCPCGLEDRVQLQEKRDYDEQIIKEMKDHIKRDGVNIIPPIIVIKCEHDLMTRPFCECGYEYELVDGQHRLKTLRRLGYDEIYARIYYTPQVLRWKPLPFYINVR